MLTANLPVHPNLTMNIRPILALTCIITSAAFAADAPKAPAIPSHPIAKKKELLFSDDFKGAEHDKRWHNVVPTFTFEPGALKGTQTRDKDIPAADGKPAVTAHAAVFGLELPTKDSVIEVKIRFAGNTRMDVEFDDRKYTGSHYGHLCRAIVALNGVTIMDEREGSQNEAIKALRADPSKKDEVNKLMAGKSATFPGTFEAARPTPSPSRPSARRCARALTASPSATSSPPASAIRRSPRSNSASPARMATSRTSKSGTRSRRSRTPHWKISRTG